MKQEPAAFLMRSFIRVRCPDAWISATAGMSMTETELVMAEGKRMQGSAIPVRTP